MTHSIQRRFPRPITIGICVEPWVHFRLQPCFHNLLCDSIRNCGNSQTSFSTTLLWYLHCPDWRRKVAARRHPIPDPVKVLLQLPFKILDPLPIGPSSSFIPFPPLIPSPAPLLAIPYRLSL